MNKQLILALMLLLSALPTLAQESHLEPFPDYRARAEKAFAEKMALVGQQFYDLQGQQVSPAERDALHFLYAYMPVADVTDYPTSFYLANIRESFNTREQTSWGRRVPELLFRHFVLPLRVNNEPLDSFRIRYSRELQQRVSGLSMADAILEINHWCHEHATYEPSDARTSSPLQTMRTAKGRCGEESTFAVAALRAAGIPARQVYTPRWAHTDDNHAWVEAWADGRWYFLGACEPEAVLNLGWFNAPASRAMLMHTRVFGDYMGPEEVMLRTSNFTEINLIDNYGSTARVDFTICNPDSTPAAGARVDFKIYNYAEFYTAVTKYADDRGRTFLTAGKGDMLVWARHDGRYGYAKASFGKDKTIKIVLEYSFQDVSETPLLAVEELDIVPPPEQVTLPGVPEALAECNRRRLAQEDSIRAAYTSTFFDERNTAGEPAELVPYLVKARGNWRVIAAFFHSHGDNPQRALSLLATLSDKDLRDMQREILDDSYLAESDQLSPRVEDEMIIHPFKGFFERQFSETEKQEFRDDPVKLVEWVRRNIRLNPDTKALRIAQTPIGVWHSRLTDPRSRIIFFVDVARSLGIEARRDAVTGKTQYRKDGRWHDVNFETATQQTAPQGMLVLRFEPEKWLDNPKYYTHFTISRINQGVTRLLNFDEGQVDMGGGTTWRNTFKDGVGLDEGTYLLTTGTRLANGSVLATNQQFTIYRGGTTSLDLRLRHSDSEVSVIGAFDSESCFTKDGRPVSILSQTGRGYYVLGLLGVGQEPTNHALRDIAKVKDELDKWGRPFVLLCQDAAAMTKFNMQDYGRLPEKTTLGIDTDATIHEQVCREMKLQNPQQRPIFIIADTFNRVVFVSQGYTIGLGEQLLKVANKL